MASGRVHWLVLSPDLLYLERQQPQNLVGINQKLDRSGLTRCPADVTLFLKFQDHLMEHRWGDPKERHCPGRQGHAVSLFPKGFQISQIPPSSCGTFIGKKLLSTDVVYGQIAISPGGSA